MPPIVRLPAAPPDLTANRRSATVDLRVTIPSANTDGSHPANISRVDIYAATAPPTISDADLLKRGKKIASFPVKAPPDPDEPAEADEDATEVEPPQGAGLDQGAAAETQEDLSAVPPEKAAPAPSSQESSQTEKPLLNASGEIPSRTYAAVAYNNHGRRGPLSKRVAVPLIEAPPRVARPETSYDETGVTVTWPSVGQKPAQADPDLLPSHPLISGAQERIVYNVYDPSQNNAKLTTTPIVDPQFVDHRMDWGAKRCYAVRAARAIGDLVVEGDLSEPDCVTLVDTFPPAAPKDLQTAPSQGAVNLIWDANTEKDVAGYIVLRGDSPNALTPITPAPIPAPTYRDEVPSGFHAFYAVEAVDKAGNISQPSSPAEETAR